MGKLINWWKSLFVQNNIPVIEVNVDKFREEVLTLINDFRKKHGLNELIFNEQLNKCAQDHARFMAQHNDMSHSDDGTLILRLKNAGYNYTNCGECLAMGSATSEQTVDMWIDDWAHRAILLGTFTELGIGMCYSGYGTAYWSADFGKQ